VELDDLEVRALGGQLADQVQDEVLGTDAGRELALDLDLDRAGNLDVQDAAERPDGGHLGRADAEGQGAERAVARGVRVGADDHVAGPHVAVLGQDLMADAALVAAHVVELGDLLRAANSRTFFWLVAVLADSAGTRWSKMMAMRSGSQTLASRPVSLKTSVNWLSTSAAFSWDIAMSTRGSTTSPALTVAWPVARARIFSATVMPIAARPFPPTCRPASQ
jgi:hypothetical protein